MTELIIGVILAAAKWLFGMLGENAEKKKRIARLITEWMRVMRTEFLASSEISEEFEKLWAEADKTPWKETKK